MKSFFLSLFGVMPKDSEYTPIPRPVGIDLAIPLRPSTAQLIEDLMVDPEALKMETHEPGVFDEDGDYIPQYSDDPRDLENIQATPLDAPDGGTNSESVPDAQSDVKPDSSPTE